MSLVHNFLALYFWMLMILPALEAKASDIEALESSSGITSFGSTVSLKGGETENLNEVLSSLDKPHTTKSEDKITKGESTTNVGINLVKRDLYSESPAEPQYLLGGVIPSYEQKELYPTSKSTGLYNVEKFPGKDKIWYVTEKIDKTRAPIWENYIKWQHTQRTQNMKSYESSQDESKLTAGQKAILYACRDISGGIQGLREVLDVAVENSDYEWCSRRYCPKAQVFTCYVVRSEKEPTTPLHTADFERVLMSIGYVTSPESPFGMHLGIFRSVFLGNAEFYIPKLSLPFHSYVARQGLSLGKTHMVCTPMGLMSQLFIQTGEKGGLLESKIFTVKTKGIGVETTMTSNRLEFIWNNDQKGFRFTYPNGTTLTVDSGKNKDFNWLLETHGSHGPSSTFIIDLNDLAKL